MSFGDRLKESRLRLGLKQSELANKLGVSNSAIANYETEVSSPKEEILLKIFDVLQVSPNFLFQDSFQNVEDVLTFEEKEYIDKYRELDNRGKKAVKNCINFEYEQVKIKDTFKTDENIKEVSFADEIIAIADEPAAIAANTGKDEHPEPHYSDEFIAEIMAGEDLD